MSALFRTVVQVPVAMENLYINRSLVLVNSMPLSCFACDACVMAFMPSTYGLELFTISICSAVTAVISASHSQMRKCLSCENSYLQFLILLSFKLRVYARAVIKFLSRRNLLNVTRNMNYMAVVHVSEGSKSLSF